MRQKNPLFQEPMRFWLEHWYRVIYDRYILITSSSSFHEFITNEFNDLLPVGLLAQMVERSTGIAEVKGSNPVQAWNFSGFLFPTAKVASTITAMKFFDVITLICVGDVRVSIATVFFFLLKIGCSQKGTMCRRTILTRRTRQVSQLCKNGCFLVNPPSSHRQYEALAFYETSPPLRRMRKNLKLHLYGTI